MFYPRHQRQTDFIPGTLQDLPSPIKLDGIAGGLVVTKQGQVCWEALDDFGNVVPFQTQAFYQEKLPCRLLSPQAFLKHSSQRIEDHFKIFHNRAELHQDGSKILTIPYNATFLPSITLFRRGKAEESLQAMYNSVVGENNANISPKAKHLVMLALSIGSPCIRACQTTRPYRVLGFYGELAMEIRIAPSSQVQCMLL